MESDHTNQDRSSKSTDAEITVGQAAGSSSTNNNNGIPLSQQAVAEQSADDASSAWETESDSSTGPSNINHPNLNYTDPHDIHNNSYDSFDDDMYDDDDFDGEYDDDFDEDFDAFDEFGGFDETLLPNLFTASDSFFNIERLTPSVRANRRPDRAADDPDDDIMSEFSGDEKYEPKEFDMRDEDGQGSADMFDFDPMEHISTSPTSNAYLTESMRQLMIKLSHGRRARERKLGVQRQRENSNESAAGSSATTEGAQQESLPKSGHYLSKLMVRGRDYPQELAFSPAISFHYQCANSLVVSPSNMAVHDDVYTIHHRAIYRCGIPDPTIITTDYDLYVNSRIDKTKPRTSEYTLFTRKSEPLTTFKATKYLKSSVHRFDHIMPSGSYVDLDDYDGPLCVAHRFGYLAHGTDEGYLVVYCTDCGDEVPEQIYYDELLAGSRRVMINSIQIVRWPRYGEHKTHRDKTDAGIDIDADMMDDKDEDDLDPDELRDGYPSPYGQFDHYMVVTANEKGLFIVSLPDHLHPKSSYEIPEHDFKFRAERHTWIRTGFQRESLNDAKVSPNGQWIAIVGDTQRVWTIEVRHVPETEEQRKEREKEEHEIMVEELETDSEYATENSSEEENDISKDARMATDGQGRWKRQRGAPDTDEEKSHPGATESGSAGSTKSRLRPRLLHQFDEPREHFIPDKVLYPPPNTKNGRRPLNRPNYASQYISWNASSTKFAHTSDTSSRVVVWSMPARDIVCCVDVGGLSYAIDFHPTLENLFACANWYGFVHVVDISGCCIGDLDLVPTNVRYDGRATQEPGLKGCEGPHYEEKHDILMLSFRGQLNQSLRILDSIRGLGWSTDGRHLYVSTLRRVLKYALAHEQLRVPSLFELCAIKVREWKEQQWVKQPYPILGSEVQATGKGNSTLLAGKDTSIKRKRLISKASDPIAKAWPFVPLDTKRQIWGNLYHLRSHNE